MFKFISDNEDEINEPKMSPVLRPSQANPQQDLRKQLYENLMAKAQAKIKSSKLSQEDNRVSAEDIASLGDTERLSALASGLQKSANKIGSFQGNTADSSGLDNSLQSMNNADRNELKGRQGLYDQAVDEEQTGMKDAYNAEMNPINIQSAENNIRSQKFKYDVDSREDKVNLDIKAQENDPTSAISRQYQDYASKLTGGRKDMSGIPASQLKQTISGLENIYKIDENNKARRDIDNQRAQENRDRRDSINEQKKANSLSNQDKYDEKVRIASEKKAEQEDLLSVPGFDRVPGVRVTSTVANELRNGVKAQRMFKESLTELRDLVKEYGTYETGPIGARMEGLSGQILLKYKEMVNLGVLNGGDLPLIESIIPQMGNKVLARGDNTVAKIEELLKTTDRDFEVGMPGKGYTPSKSSSSTTSTQTFPMQMRDKEGVITVSSEQEMQEALKEGFSK